MKLFRSIFILLTVIYSCSNSDTDAISLAGGWHVKLDSTNVGVDEDWAVNKFSGKNINLPGTLDDAEIGTPITLEPAINNYVMSNLTRKHQYIGKAWYQKEIEIPTSWQSKDIDLKLERIIWESTVYIDGKLVGTANSLVSSHDYDLTSYLTPGKHLLTICIDNSNKFPFINVAGNKYPDKVNQDMAHAYTNHTQIKWNGILGDIMLEASNKNTPDNLQIYPDKKLNKLKISFQQPFFKEDQVNCIITSTDGNEIFNKKVSIVKNANNTLTFEIDKPNNLKLWDEFNPNLYDVEIKTIAGKTTARFGYKYVGNKEGNLTLNDKRIFLRGNLECVIFPLTGYPPTKKEEWAKLIAQAKAYGLNHLRFHSWCPPKAAFEAADEAGFYYQVELPHWSLKVGEDENTTLFLKEEAKKILKDYGNHPSFIFMAMGNELQGDISVLNDMVAELKPIDNRHLYATTAFSFQQPTGTRPEKQDEFFIAQWTDKGWIRGQGIFNTIPPHFNADYTSGAAHINIPLISHEIGQYSIYPDMSEIKKYTGVLNPLNFKAVKNDLEKKGLLEWAPKFTNASGKLAALLYKEEIERALKTPSFDGFQLLQLQDFPGQGTALVGLLNAFWESKGIISAEKFSEFNSEVVPLIRFEKATYKTGETFTASVEIANFFEEKTNQTIECLIIDEVNTVIKKEIITDVNLTIGNNINLGTINFPIEFEKAKKLTVTVNLINTKYTNSWNIWVYPKNVPTSREGIVVTASIKEALNLLKKGKKVLLSPNPKTLDGIEGRFVPVFWSPVHFPNQPATMGILLDEKNLAFNNFPTDYHSDWQWWDLCMNSKSIIIDNLEVDPIVRVIDNFVTNHHLSNIFETKIGEGKLLFSSIDLISNLEKRPVAKQLRYSLLEYMVSDEFAPLKSLKAKDLENINLKNNKSSFSTNDIYKE
ncbi:sugar-binding domain-containing protein [uncultured Polaribacter sp.]|uniref:sugar-binding domain-containing protein n=1 Tax=uncultured Polaribacter sp. TaxID=174711 RepID=UPI00262315FD|nr:sugar-binding domain-containing protein [uncultured Polaribacter sp.]